MAFSVPIGMSFPGWPGTVTTIPFSGVTELAVAAFGLLQTPAGGFEHLDQISDF